MAKIVPSAAKSPKFEAPKNRFTASFNAMWSSTQGRKLTQFALIVQPQSCTVNTKIVRKICPYVEVTWYVGACAVAANALSVVSYGRSKITHNSRMDIDVGPSKVQTWWSDWPLDRHARPLTKAKVDLSWRWSHISYIVNRQIGVMDFKLWKIALRSCRSQSNVLLYADTLTLALCNWKEKTPECLSIVFTVSQRYGTFLRAR